MTTSPQALDLFPELPAPAQPMKKRARRSNNLQPGATTVLAPAPLSGAAEGDAEAAARLLAMHPDFRVLRRLQPRLHWPASGHETRTVLILDTETTGLDASRDSIIELAILRLRVDVASGQPVGEVEVYDELEDPGRPIPPEVVAITGITDQDVRGRRLDETRILAMLEGADLVIAHNAGFDRPFVEKRVPQFAELAWACSFADIDWKARGHGSAKLESLALDQGFFYDAHRADTDCHALLAILASPLTAEGSTGLIHLMRASTQPSLRLSALQTPFESKDKLKTRGYRWDGEKRVWALRLAQSHLDSELQWLATHVYTSQAAQVEVETMDSTRKYSLRPGPSRRIPVFSGTST